MTKQEFTAALAIAKSDDDLRPVNIDVFNGYGLTGFKLVYVTIEQIARLIRWQAGRFDGQWDSTEINEIGRLGRRLFRVIG